MERLTDRNPYNEAYSYGACQKIKCDLDCAHCKMNVLIERLCSIEDILGPTYDLSRLRELVEADRENYIITATPVRKGQHLYWVLGGEVFECIPYMAYIDGDCGLCYQCKSAESGRGVAFALTEIGKTVFFTREEAEKALEEQYET